MSKETRRCSLRRLLLLLLLRLPQRLTKESSSRLLLLSRLRRVCVRILPKRAKESVPGWLLLLLLLLLRLAKGAKRARRRRSGVCGLTKEIWGRVLFISTKRAKEGHFFEGDGCLRRKPKRGIWEESVPYGATACTATST